MITSFKLLYRRVSRPLGCCNLLTVIIDHLHPTFWLRSRTHLLLRSNMLIVVIMSSSFSLVFCCIWLKATTRRATADVCWDRRASWKIPSLPIRTRTESGFDWKTSHVTVYLPPLFSFPSFSRYGFFLSAFFSFFFWRKKKTKKHTQNLGFIWIFSSSCPPPKNCTLNIFFTFWGF